MYAVLISFSPSPCGGSQCLQQDQVVLFLLNKDASLSFSFDYITLPSMQYDTMLKEYGAIKYRLKGASLTATWSLLNLSIRGFQLGLLFFLL